MCGWDLAEFMSLSCRGEGLLYLGIQRWICPLLLQPCFFLVLRVLLPYVRRLLLWFLFLLSYPPPLGGSPGPALLLEGGLVGVLCLLCPGGNR